MMGIINIYLGFKGVSKPNEAIITNVNLTKLRLARKLWPKRFYKIGPPVGVADPRLLLARHRAQEAVVQGAPGIASQAVAGMRAQFLVTLFAPRGEVCP
jgi:hypothetical protein